MAKQEKLIPCRVCGKMFKPCSYCQSHQDVFRWRNFACSIECAKIYIANTEEYRAMQKAQKEAAEVTVSKKGRKKANTKTKQEVEASEVVEETTVVEDETIVKETPIAEDAPVIEDAPIVDEQPVSDDESENTEGDSDDTVEETLTADIEIEDK